MEFQRQIVVISFFAQMRSSVPGVSRLDDQIFINRNPGVPSVVKFHPFNPCIAVADKDSIWWVGRPGGSFKEPSYQWWLIKLHSQDKVKVNPHFWPWNNMKHWHQQSELISDLSRVAALQCLRSSFPLNIFCQSIIKWIPVNTMHPSQVGALKTHSGQVFFFFF